MIAQVMCQFLSIEAVPFHPEMKGLDPAQNKETVLRTRYCTTRVADKGKLSIKLFIIHNQRTHDHIRVTAQVLRYGVHDDVRTEIEWVLKIG